MRKRNALSILLLFAAPVAVNAGPFKDEADMSSQQKTYAKSSMEAVKRRLKDPESAKFRDLYTVQNQGRQGQTVYVSCGYVNAKNGFGGYSGFDPFVVTGDDQRTYFGGREEDKMWFDLIWEKRCQ